MHQLPPRPVGLRVKVWRRLQQQGAIAIKNSVYALPLGDGAREDFQWLAREIIERGGEATVCAAELVEGLTDAQVQALFHAARDADYAEVARKARQLAAARGRRASDEAWPLKVNKLRKRLGEIIAIDFLGAPGREAAEGLVSRLEDTLSRELARSTDPIGVPETGLPRGAVWVTRQGIHVDRMASAWLIRRFIDPEARLRFVDPRSVRAPAWRASLRHVRGRVHPRGGPLHLRGAPGAVPDRDPAARGPRRDGARHRPQGRQVLPSRDRGLRARRRRHRARACRGRDATGASQRAPRRPAHRLRTLRAEAPAGGARRHKGGASESAEQAGGGLRTCVRDHGAVRGRRCSDGTGKRREGGRGGHPGRRPRREARDRAAPVRPGEAEGSLGEAPSTRTTRTTTAAR